MEVIIPLKTARELYPNTDENDYSPFYCYTPITDSFGKILVQIDEGNYQGDSWILYDFEDGTYGYLCFGWGSCSGCDALQACRSYDDADNLIKSLHNSIRIYTKEELIQFFSDEKVLEQHYSWHAQDFQKFLEKVGELFGFTPPIVRDEEEED